MAPTIHFRSSVFTAAISFAISFCNFSSSTLVSRRSFFYSHLGSLLQPFHVCVYFCYVCLGSLPQFGYVCLGSLPQFGYVCLGSLPQLFYGYLGSLLLLFYV